VWSEDAPTGGTRFVVELPLHPVGDDPFDPGESP
jgi:signal transduction histidine kinase